MGAKVSSPPHVSVSRHSGGLILFQVSCRWAQIQFTCPPGENGFSPISRWHLLNQVSPAVLMSWCLPWSPGWPVCPAGTRASEAASTVRIHPRVQACVSNQISGSSTGRQSHFAALLVWRLNRQPSSSITGFRPSFRPSLMSKWHLETVVQEGDGDGGLMEAERCWNGSSDPAIHVAMVTKRSMAR